MRQQWTNGSSIGVWIKSFQVQYSVGAVVFSLSKESYSHCSSNGSLVLAGDAFCMSCMKISKLSI